MRRLRFLLAGVLVVAPLSIVVAAPADAATPGGTYVALPVPTRVVDSRTGAAGNRLGAVPAGQAIHPTIAGRGGLPASGIAAVAGTLTAVSPTANGGLVGYGATRPSTTDLQFVKGHAITDSVILPVSAGRLYIANTATSGSVQIVLDVSGYYTSGTASTTDAGIYRPIHPSRVVDSRTGVDGNRKGALKAGATIAPVIGGHAGIPRASGEVAVTITVLSPTRAGSILGYRPGEPRQNLPLLRFAAGQPMSAFAVLRMSAGKVELVNDSPGTLQITVDVLGYYNSGFAQTAHALQSVVPTRILAATAAANAELDVHAGGQGGVPRSGVAAVLADVHVASPTRAGYLQAWQAGHARPSGPVVLHFDAGQTISNTILVPVSSDGTFALHNSSPAQTTVNVDIEGYVPDGGLSVPAMHGIGHYVRNANATFLGGVGAADGAAGVTFALLDIGAQANDKKGVVLSGTNTEVHYENLVSALRSYLASLHAGEPAAAVTVAIATNNDGTDWTKYVAADRAHDWWTEVVSQLQGAQPDVRVVGADDIEPGFFSTRAEALAWETNYFDADTTHQSQLYFVGSADGCPQTWTAGATCAFGWTESQLYQLATGNGNAARTRALPQIYYGYMATQWAEIDRTGGGGITFAGSLTTHATDASTLTGPTAWTALDRAVSSVSTKAIGNTLADIRVN